MIKIQVNVPVYSREEYKKLDVLRAHLNLAKDYSFDWQPVMGPVIELNRNNAVTDSPKERPDIPEVDYFLCLDTDMEAKRRHIFDLIEHAIENDLDILGALYLRNMPENATGASIYNASYDGQSFIDEIETGIRPCKFVGTGCLLIKREVFVKMDKPWFETAWLRKDGEVQHISEDFAFCAKALQAGFNVNIDHDVLVRHNLRYGL